MARLELRAVAHRYGTRPALAPLSLACSAGDWVLLSGPSGSGKTTLLRIIAGLLAPAAGAVYLEGALASEAGRVQRAAHRRGIGMAFQEGALWPHVRLEKQVALVARNAGYARVEAHERAAALLAAVGLGEYRQALPHACSGGQQQRAGVARALASGAPLLLFDEPTAHLDDASAAQTVAAVRAWARADATVIVATHEPGPWTRHVAQTVRLAPADQAGS